MGELVGEVSELHDAREPSRRPGRLRDPAHVDLVGLPWSVGQKLQGVQLDRGFVGSDWHAVCDSRIHSPSCHLQLHFDLLASPKLLTALATLVALVAIAASWADEGLAGSAATALWSASTDDFKALVWLEKSLLAELTSDVASLWIFVTCDFSPLTSPLETELASPLMELSRVLQSEQYAGLLPPLLAVVPLPPLVAALPLPLAPLLAVLPPPPLLPQPTTATSAIAMNTASGMRVQVRRTPWGAFPCRLVSSLEDTVHSLSMVIEQGSRLLRRCPIVELQRAQTTLNPVRGGDGVKRLAGDGHVDSLRGL